MIYRFDEFELDPERCELRRAGKLLRADALVLRLLTCLVKNAGRLVTKDEFVEHVWEGRAVADNAITVSMARLRKTLSHGAKRRPLVATVYGRGYRLDCRVDTIAQREPALSEPASLGEAPPPFVGRERVLSGLRSAAARAREGHGRACVLLGEPGIGKTHTAQALARELAGPDVRVAWGHCREAGDTPPLWPWLRVLREVVEHTRPSRSGDLAATTAELLALCDEPTGYLAPGLATLVARGAARHRTFDNLLRVLGWAAEQTPWLLILEDIHRADAASLEFFGYLLDELAHTRLLVLATARNVHGSRDAHPSRELAQVLGHPNSERFPLERLTRDQVQAYVKAVLDDPDGRLADAVFVKSEGNPFFMAELARRLRAAELPDPSAIDVPDAALDLIRQSLAQLDPESRRVLSAASVFGRSFELARLQAITEREPGELMACLDDALASGLLIAAPDSMTAFAFGHELVRAALYDGLPAAERRLWHLRICRVLEGRRSAGEPIASSELAHHAHAALPDSDPRRAIEHCRAAAAAAAARFANLDVVRYLRHALEALELIPNASPRLRINLLFGTALYARSCEPEESARALAAVLQLARERGDAALIVRAACMLNVHPGYKPLPGSSPALRHALQLAAPDDHELRAPGLAALAAAAPHCFSAEQAETYLDEALERARRVANPVTLYATLTYRLWTLCGPDRPEESAAVTSELDRLAQENPERMPVLPLDLALYRVMTALQQGDQNRARAALDLVASRAAMVGKGEFTWHIERARVLARINAGDTAGALEALASQRRVAELRSFIGTAPFCAFDRVVLAREIDDNFHVDSATRDALAYDASEPPSIWSMKVRALAAANLMDDARGVLSAVPPDKLAALPRGPHYLGTLGHIARAALDLHALDYAAALYPLLARFPDAFALHVSFLCEGSVSQLLGALAHALGRRADAVAHFERAIAANERAGYDRCATEARLQLARCLLEDRNGARASRVRSLAREAHSGAQRMGSRSLAVSASNVLRLTR